MTPRPFPALIDARRTVTDPCAPRGQHLMSWLLLKGERGQTCNQTRLLQLRRRIDGHAPLALVV